MIEIKITLDSALQLLMERMKHELRLRQLGGNIFRGINLDELSVKELQSITDAAVFDTIFLLPIEIVIAETNLIKIIGTTVRALSKVLHKEEFLLFTDQKAKSLVQPIINYLKTQVQVKEEKFFRN